ncbi:MAG: SdrD B-like domain-containing protein, partial [Acidobacteriota bacterium]
SGWTIEVDLNSDGSTEHATTTDSNGEYRFTHIGLGDLKGDRSFIVREVSRAGWVQTAPLGNTPLPMHSGLLARVDFGNFRFMTIRGKKFHDLNGNGTPDAGEPGLAGWEIELDLNRDGTVDRRAATDSNGNYQMLNVGPGDPLGSRELSLSEVDQPGWSPTFPTTGHIYPIHSGVVLVADFGNAQGTGICGAKYEDLNGNGIRDAGEPGIGGWTIDLTKPDGSTEQEVTDAGGGFCFSDLEPGNYTVGEASRQGWIRTQPGGSGRYTIGLESGQSRQDVWFGNFREAELCGLKFNDLNGDGVHGTGEPGLAGWTIRLTRPDGSSTTKQTGAGGSYCFTQLGPGSHTLREVQQTGWVQTYPASSGGHTVSTESGKTTNGLDFGNRSAGGTFVPVSICGSKFEDVNGDGTRQNGEPGLAGWTIQLLAGTSTIVQSVATDATGGYCFGQIGAGTYTIREVQQDGWVRKRPAGPGTHTIVTESGKNLAELDFGNFKLGRITGKKYNDLNSNGLAEASEPGLSGWTIFVDLNRDGILNNPKLAGVCDASAVEPCAKTDAGGRYTIGGLDIGAYALREVQQPGWRQTTANPADASVSTSSAVLSGRDFGNVASASADRVRLYFPFYQAGSGIFTAFAVSNYSTNPANVKFTAYTEEGELCPFEENPAVAQLPAGHQIARLGNEIFGEDATKPQLGWVEVRSDNPEIGGFFQFGTSDLEGLDGSVAISEPSAHFYLTRIYEFTDEVTTHIAVANPGDSAIRAVLTYLDISYPYEPNATVSKTFDIPARGMLSGSVADLFDGLQGAGCIEVEIQNSGKAVGFELIRQISPKSLIGLNGITLDGQTASYSAQLASTADVFTSLKLMNTHRTEDREVDIGAIGPTGEVFEEVYWLFYPEEQYEGFAADIFGIDFVEDPFVGSLRVKSDTPYMVGDVMFGDAYEGKYLAAVPLQTQAFRRAVFNHVANGLGFFTGLAFHNPSVSTAQIHLRVMTPEGQMVGDHSFTLAPGHRTSATVGELVPGSNGQVGGYVLIDSSIPIIAQQLFGLSNLSLMSAVPPTVIE